MLVRASGGAPPQAMRGAIAGGPHGAWGIKTAGAAAGSRRARNRLLCRLGSVSIGAAIATVRKRAVSSADNELLAPTSHAR